MNSIFVIHPYRWKGTWVFDDEEKGLDKEPFVMGIPDIIDRIVGNANRFTCYFAATPIPSQHATLDRREPDSGGTWYQHRETGLKGWLCPALFKYFPTAPETINIRFEI